MKNLHIFLNSKGGVGKSFCAINLTQFMREKVDNLMVFDTDPSNQTLFNFSDLNATFIDVKSEKNVEIGNFDDLINYINDKFEHLIIDSGASNAIPFFHYLVDEGGEDVLNQMGYQIFIHVPVVGGDAFKDCKGNLKMVFSQLKHAKIIIWYNNFPKPVFAKSEKSAMMAELTNEIIGEEGSSYVGYVELPYFEPTTTGKMLKQIMEERKTYNQLLDGSVQTTLFNQPLRVLEKVRIKKIKDDIFNAISNIEDLIF